MTDGPPWRQRRAPLPEPHLARLRRLTDQGSSLEEAAEAVGLTLSLAKSVFIRSGLPIPKPLRRSKARVAPPVRPGLGRRIHRYLDRVDRATVVEVAKALKVPTAEVRAAWWPVDKPRQLARRPRSEVFSDTAILLGLQIMSIDRGRRQYAQGRVPVSAAWWDAHRDPTVHPPAAYVRLRFGSWTKACERAGVPNRRQLRPAGARRRWSDAELAEHLRAFLASGTGISAAAYEAWSSGRPDTPSATTFSARFGSWTKAREAANAQAPEGTR